MAGPGLDPAGVMMLGAALPGSRVGLQGGVWGCRQGVMLCVGREVGFGRELPDVCKQMRAERGRAMVSWRDLLRDCC